MSGPISREIGKIVADLSHKLLFRMRETFAETYTNVRAWAIPVPDRYPTGVKYATQYGERGGATILQYDNFPDHLSAAHHHKYIGENRVVDVEFTGVFDLHEQFKQEVDEHEH